MRRRSAVEAASLSFLDVICCGFGAIILLLVLTKVFEPVIIEEASIELDGVIADLQRQLFDIRGETRILNRQMITHEDQVSLSRERLARLQREISKILGEFAASKEDSELAAIIQGKLADARQTLTEEQKRLQARVSEQVETDLIGGIPVDSEYVIFIIDTSGSMVNYSWPLVVEKFRETLEIYPEVKGIQVMNDMGQYMFTRYKNQWIPDSPGRRRAIIDRLKSWQAFSNSSPVEGITKAISTFYEPGKKISLYVFGDEFTGRSIDKVLATVSHINREDRNGNRLVRINAVGFPVQFIRPKHLQQTGERFATLMRILCEENGGTFVGLPHIRS